MNIILCAKSSSGKDFARNYLISEYGFEPIISTTTRPPRINETHGVDYYFWSEDNFLRRLDEFIEVRKYEVAFEGNKQTWWYGTHWLEIKYCLQDNKVGIKDCLGARQIKEQFPNTKIVYIHCDDNIRRDRAKSRGSFDVIEWDRRLQADAIDFNFEDIINVTDYYVTNNEGEEEFKKQLDIVVDMIFEEND